MKPPALIPSLLLVLAALAAAPLRGQPLAYDTSAWELAPSLPADPAPWTRADLERELSRRNARQKARREIVVYYYRIGHTLAFPLPVTRRPSRAELPPGVANLTYPWLIWLTWELEERWQILHAAWRTLGDSEAARLLQHELAALSGWETFTEMNDRLGLGAAHLAGCLSSALADPSGWDPELLARARAAARHLLGADVPPWYASQWATERPWTPQRLANIPVITLARAAELARITGDPQLAVLDAKAVEILRTWARFRTGPERHTEGTTYDGYLLDSVTAWLARHPERPALLAECGPALRSVTEQWIHLALPGRADLHAPIGDVEPEMPFWTTVLARAAAWQRLPEAVWLLQRVPVTRLPAAMIVETLGTDAVLHLAPRPPVSAPREHPHALSLRSGWSSGDAAAIVSAVRTPMGHLQADAGHVVLGWQGRFWITDPGYQQYRAGEERDYTLGLQAHNAPVIDGLIQKQRAARVESIGTDAAGRQHTRLQLAGCYPGLPPEAVVSRELWFARDGATALVVRDTFANLPGAAEIRYHWLGGHHLAWAFVEGWARLSDGRRAVWLGQAGSPLSPTSLARHPGSRGPIAVTTRQKLAGTGGNSWWVMWCDESGGWTPPTLAADDRTLSLTPPGPARATLTFAP